VPQQVGGIRDPGPSAPVAGARQQNREHLFLVLATERRRIARQRTAVAALERSLVAHAPTIPERAWSRVIATLALARKRAASSASRSLPPAVNR
jgi:hypothetical protein